MAKMLIAGEPADSESGQTTEVRNPATGEVVDNVPKGTITDIRRAIDAAKGALKKWSAMAPSKRGAVLLAAGHTILQQEKELATLLTKEQGKPMRESILEIRRFVHTLDHYGGMAKTMRTSAVMLDTGRHGHRPAQAARSLRLHRAVEFSRVFNGQQARSRIACG